MTKDPTDQDEQRWWTDQRGPGPIVATAIHDGAGLRGDVARAMKLPAPDRLREEDPFTGQAIVNIPTNIPTNITVHRSRFEFDLNRAAEAAVYATPDQSWGLDLWHTPPTQAMIAASLGLHARYYRMLGQLLDDVAADHARFVVLDVHSYNHRRDGPAGDPTAQAKAPDINIGTSTSARILPFRARANRRASSMTATRARQARSHRAQLRLPAVGLADQP